MLLAKLICETSFLYLDNNLQDSLRGPVGLLHTTEHSQCCRVWGKMSTVGQSRSPEIFIFMPKIRKPMVIRSRCLFHHWNRKSKTDDHVIPSLSIQKQKYHLTHFAPPYSITTSPSPPVSNRFPGICLPADHLRVAQLMGGMIKDDARLQRL